MGFAVVASLLLPMGAASQGRVLLPEARAAAVGADAGLVPESQPVPDITVTLKRSAAQQAALDSYLRDVRTAGSSTYHQWLSPKEFAARFAPSAADRAKVTDWLQSQGLQVTAISAGGMRVLAKGTAGQAGTAFAAPLRRLATPAGESITVSGTPSVPLAVGGLVRAVSGLEMTAAGGPADLLGAAVEADASAVVLADWKGEAAPPEVLEELLDEAAAQGQTVVLTHVSRAALPSRALLLVAAGDVVATGDDAATTTARPDWQVAPGLPADGLRATPDAAAADVAAVVSALESVALKNGRQGEIASRFYAVASEPGVFRHADAAVPAGNWAAADGLGTVDPANLLHALATGATPPLTSVITLSSRNVTHGQPVTLTATITGGSGTPTGTVTFATAQDGTLGSATLSPGTATGSAVATFSASSLPGGLHGFYGTYNGDSTYTVSTTNVDTATVQPEAVNISGGVSGNPSVGLTVPVMVLAKSPSGVGTPSGTVTVYAYGTALGQTGFTGTLQQQTAGTAVASVTIPATNAGTFTFQANCVTSADFSCNTPATFSVTIAKGTPAFTLKQTGSSAMTLTATATAPAGAASTVVTPTGTVQFLNNGTAFASVPLDSTGTAFYAGTITAKGPLTASYSGDGNYSTATATANAANTKVTPAVALAVVTAGSSLSATVTAPAGTAATPTGTVQFLLGSTALGTATLTNGVATFTGSYGSGTLTAVYSGDTNFNTATSNAIDTTKVTPTVTLTKTSSSTATNTVALSAAVTSASSKTASGTVQFLDGTTAIGTGTLNASGVATFSGALAANARGGVGPLATTTHTLTAVYGGDTSFNTATSNAVTADATTALITTTTALTSSSGYSGPYGTSFTFNVVVTPASYAATGVSPSGTVTLSDASGVVGMGTLSNGSATITVSTLSVGAHALTATYGGDSFYAASTSSPVVTVTVSAVTATIAATLSPSGSVPYGYDANLNVTVTANSGTTGPAGTVTATVNGATYSATLSATTGSLASTATISFPVPPPGTYTITVTCGAGITCTNSATARLTTTKGYTKTTLSVASTAPQAGVGTTLTATVANTGTGSGTYSYRGTVTFYAGNKVLGSATVANGAATATVVYTSAMSQSVYAVYSGDTNWNGSTSDPVTVTPLPIQPVIGLSANTLNGIVGQNMTLTASISSGLTTVTLVPTGKVTFYDTYNGVVVNLGSAALLSNGLNAAYGTISTTGLQAGAHNVIAVYAGDNTFSNVTSAAIVVNMGDFSLSFVPQTPVVSQGGTAQVTVIVGSLNGFTGTVALGCTPPGGTLTACSVTPSSVPAGSSAVLTVTTTKSTAKAVGSRSKVAIAGAGLLAMSLLGLRRRRAVPVLLLMAVAVLVSGGCTQVAMTGDSGGNAGTGGGGNNGTPLGTLSFTVTGVAVDAPVAARRTTVVSITVQ